MMSGEITDFWLAALDSRKIEYKLSTKQTFKIIVFVTEGCKFKIFINEEECYFAINLSTNFPVSKSQFLIDENALVARLNNSIQTGQFSWKMSKLDDQKLIIYKTSQFLIRKNENNRFILEHLDHHTSIIKNLKSKIENSKVLNLNDDFYTI